MCWLVVCSSFSLLWSPYGIGQTIIFHPLVSIFFFFFFSSLNLSGRTLDVYQTMTHGIALLQILNAGLKRAACGSLEMQDPKNCQKFAIWAPSHNFVRLYLRNYGMYQQSEKKLVKQQYLLHMSPQYGELRPTSGWDRFCSLGHPSKFQRVSLLGSFTAWHCSSGHQPNFAALAGRPSCWALAHILVVSVMAACGSLCWLHVSFLTHIVCI